MRSSWRRSRSASRASLSCEPKMGASSSWNGKQGRQSRSRARGCCNLPRETEGFGSAGRFSGILIGTNYDDQGPIIKSERVQRAGRAERRNRRACDSWLGFVRAPQQAPQKSRPRIFAGPNRDTTTDGPFTTQPNQSTRRSAWARASTPAGLFGLATLRQRLGMARRVTGGGCGIQIRAS